MTIDFTQDATFAVLVEAARSDIASFKEVDSRYVAANGDEAALLSSFLKDSPDEKAVKYRETIANLEANFLEYAKESVQTVTLSADDKAKLTAERTEKRAQVQNVLKGMRLMAETLTRVKGEDYLAAFEEWLTAEGDPIKASRGAGGGSNLPKVSVTIAASWTAVEGQPASTKVFGNFTEAGTWLKASTEDLQKAVAEAAELPHERLSELSRTVTLPWQRGAVTVQLEVTPKETKRGQKPAAAAPAATPEQSAE